MPNPKGDASYDIDVIIFGAGPIGLATACALAHHGVQFRIFEQRREPKPWSRANNLWARPQELLASIGIREQLAEKCYAVTKANTLLNGRVVDPIEINEVDSPFPKLLYGGQDVFEKILSEQVEAKGGSVERGRRVTGFKQDESGVTVTVATVSENDENELEGPTETLRCRYMIGADGAEALVRKTLGLDFEAEKFPNRMNRQIDAKLKWRRSTDPDQIWFFYYPQGFCGVLPVWGGYHRLFFLADSEGVPNRDPTLEEMVAIAREVTEDETLTLTDPIWLSHSWFQHGVAKSYIQGRVLMAGDAGHLTLPIGGQGMNAGFHDAIGVAWRLAMVLEGIGEGVLLESYDAERGSEHQRLDGQQAQGFRNVVYRGPLKDAALDLGAKLLPNIGSLIQGTDDLQQLSVSYPKSSLNDDHLDGLHELLRRGVPHPGDRAPDAQVIASDGAATSLFANIYNPDGRTFGWSLLGFDGRRSNAISHLLSGFTEVSGWDWVRPRLVLGAGSPPPDGVMVLSDLDGAAHSAYGVTETPAFILIRPDGHIAFRGPADRPELLRSYCERVFGAFSRQALPEAGAG